MKSTEIWSTKYGVFSSSYFLVFRLKSVWIQENTDQKKLPIWTLFTQCRLLTTKACHFKIRKSFVLSLAIRFHLSILHLNDRTLKSPYTLCNKNVIQTSILFWILIHYNVIGAYKYKQQLKKQSKFTQKDKKG